MPANCLPAPNLEEVALSAGFDVRTKSNKEFEAVMTSLRSRIQVVGGRENIYSIVFSDTDREKAVAVVDTLVKTFIERSLSADRTESGDARSFLEEAITDYEARLTAAENRLADFKRENVAFMPGQQGGYFTRLQASRTALDVVQGKLRLAEGRRSELMRQLEGEEPVFGIMGPQPGSDVDGGFSSAKIRELELQLEELRLQYTDKHPRIGQILETIELLKKQQAEERLTAADQRGDNYLLPESNPLDLNPVYQNMRIQLSNTDVEIAALRVERSRQVQDVAELRQLVDTVPQVEAKLNSLNRDYGVVKTKYEQLLRQLETANIGEDLEASLDAFQFRVIDPPFASRTPVGPKRQMFLAGVLLAAIGFGGVLALLLNEIHPVFYAGREITAVTGLPVLGAVSALFTPADIRSKKIGRLASALAIGMLVISYAVVAVFSEQLSPALRALKDTVL